MKKSLIALGILGAISSVSFATSNVTLYGVIEGGVLVQKAKGQNTTVQLSPGFDQGDRWGIKGVEELGNGYNVGFILEQGFNMDDGTASKNGYAFSREAFLYVTGGFGKIGFGRTGALSSGAQSNTIFTGWAIGTGYGGSAWTSSGMGNDFSRISNTVAYASPVISGFSGHLMYSNGTGEDTKTWSGNNHYYGAGVLYNANKINSSLIFEAEDNKGVEPKEKAKYVINYGLEYNMGQVTPMFAYQWAHQDGGRKTHMFGLSAKVLVAGGDLLVGARYMFGKDSPETAASEEDINAWNIAAAYVYPLSKRTVIKLFAGYVDSGKGWKSTEDVNYNGWQTFLGLRHNF